MPAIFILSLLISLLVGLGAGTEICTEKKPEGFAYFAAAVSTLLVLLLLANIDKFFKDYSTCFPI